MIIFSKTLLFYCRNNASLDDVYDILRILGNLPLYKNYVSWIYIVKHFYQYLLHLSVWNLFISKKIESLLHFILFNEWMPIQPIQEMQACCLIHFWNEWLQKILKVNLRNNLYNALQAGPSYVYLLPCRLLVSTYPTQKGNSNKTDLTQSSTVIFICHGLEPKLQNHLPIR